MNSTKGGTPPISQCHVLSDITHCHVKRDKLRCNVLRYIEHAAQGVLR